MPTRRKGAATPDPTVSAVIRDVIAARGLSGSSVADEAEVDHRVVNRFLAGKRGLSIETTDKLARALGLRLVEGRGGLRRR